MSLLVPTPYEREVAVEWLRKMLTKKPNCQYAGVKLKAGKLWHCKLAEQLTDSKVYINCEKCKELSLAKQQLVRAVIEGKLTSVEAIARASAANISLE